MNIDEKILLSMMKEHQHPFGKLSVTAMCFPCNRAAVYSLIIPPEQRGFSFSGLMRTWLGIMAHKTSILNKEMEMPVEWEGIAGIVDEYDPDEKILLDKKITAWIPKEGARLHHIRQVEYYAVLLKKNNKPVEKAYVAYIDPHKNKIKTHTVKIRPLPEIEREMLDKRDYIMESVRNGILPPRNVVPWEEEGLNLVCEYCSYISRCMREGKTIGEWL